VKLIVDMNLSPRWADLLSEVGFEAKHWSSLGPVKAADSEIMVYAASNDFVVLTHDLDFSAILAATRGQKPSVVQIRSENLSPEHIGHQIITALRQMTSELQDGALVTVTPKRTRLRILPLRPG